MINSFFMALTSVASLTFGQQIASDWHYIGSFEANQPSFVQLMHLQPSEGNKPLELDLVVSHFTEIGTNGVDAFPDIGLYLRNISNGANPPTTSLVDHTLTWPNWFYIAEPGVFPAETTLIIHDGFLTPLHTKGGVYALLLNDSQPLDLIRLSQAGGYCYVHNSTMIDMNGDGRLDILHAETCTSEFNTTDQRGSLVWLEQPASDAMTPQSWTSHSLIDGPDFFTLVDVVNASTIIVYAAQFWDPKLAYYYVQIGVDVPKVLGEAVVIDDSIGALEGLAVVDLFKDGRKQILTNSHVKEKGGVYLFEVPAGFPHDGGEFIRHEIANGTFNTTEKTGVGAPGICMPFDLNREMDAKTPFKIGVAGDGNWIEWQLTVTDQDSFTFLKEELRFVGGTTGIMAFGDVTGDGYAEMFIPYYEDGLIYVYTANPDHELVQN